MRRRKPKVPERKYERPVSLYPLKWWEVLSAFMEIPSNKAKKIREKVKH